MSDLIPAGVTPACAPARMTPARKQLSSQVIPDRLTLTGPYKSRGGSQLIYPALSLTLRRAASTVLLPLADDSTYFLECQPIQSQVLNTINQ